MTDHDQRPGSAFRQPDGRTRFWGSQEIPKTRAEFFSAVTLPAPTGEGVIATIRMYGPIDSWGGWWGISAKDFGSVLDALPDTVEQIILRINSPGGEVFEALGILNMLRAHKARVLAVVDGLAASAASLIAAGCDEVVMSPGTQMMVHSPWHFAVGNARVLRKQADILDGIERSAIEIYAAKAGGDDWEQLLADDTWFTAGDAVERGLADRVDIIPDAGPAETVGDEDEFAIIVPLDDDYEDSVALARTATRAAVLSTQTPVSTEPGTPNRKDAVMTNDAPQAGIRERLGLNAEASDEQVFSALDSLTARASAPAAETATLPEGVVTIEASTLDALRADAAAGREARDEQIAAARAATVDAAISDGRIAPSRRDHWLNALEADPGAADTLADLQPGLVVPLARKSHTGGVDQSSDEDAVYSRSFPTPTPKES